MSLPLEQSPEAPAVGYILKMFPRLSETFILNEILELERQGLRLQIFSIKKPVENLRHQRAAAVRSPIHYLPETLMAAPWQTMRGQLYVALRHRKAWRHGLRHAARHARMAGDTTPL